MNFARVKSILRIRYYLAAKIDFTVFPILAAPDPRTNIGIAFFCFFSVTHKICGAYYTKSGFIYNVCARKRINRVFYNVRLTHIINNTVLYITY